MSPKAPKPFPIQMEVEFIDRLTEPVREGKAKSVSDIIRAALGRYDFTDVLVLHPAQVQISVRLPVEIRRQLKKTARAKHTSVGHLVRAAVEAYLPELEALPAPADAPVAPKPWKRRKKKRAARLRGYDIRAATAGLPSETPGL
jgi:Arc/MetJ-type ribon-helix-helix transcriptional regulator